MKKRINKWKLFFYITVIVLPVLFVTMTLATPPQFNETYLGEFQFKKARLKEIEDRKIIIVGGSSVAFGIYSDLIEENLHIPVVNFGLYAPLGSKTMLESCFAEINEGDIIVFSPEQNKETLSFSFQAEEVWKAIDGDYSLLGIFQEAEQKKMIGAFPKFAVSKLNYVFSGKPVTNGLYQQTSFNEYGDMKALGREYNQMPEEYDPTTQIDFSEFPDDGFLQYLNEYAARVRSKGAEFYYRFCPMNELAVMNENQMDAYMNLLWDKSEFSILGNPHQCIMESGWFFDTNFHLNSAGALVNTYNFIRDLKAQMKDSSKTEIELPDMPDSSNITEKGSDEDANCFLYEEGVDGYYIIGISKEGKYREKLTIPQHYQGKEVVAVHARSFADSSQLKQIQIHGGIALLDGCFEDCETLNKIVLLAKPSEIIVGKNLLKGSNALLYTRYLEEYCVDYSWGIYSERITQ